MEKKSLFKGLLASFMLLCSAQTWAYDFEVDNIQYTITSFDDLTVEVSGLTNTDVTEVIIPETVEYRDRTLTVITIVSEVFQSNETLEYASISNTVTSIGSYAFDGCSALKEVIIGEGVTSIGSYAFRNCSSLPSVIIPNSVTSINSYVFYGCSSLTSVTIPDGVTSINSYVFYGCSSLTSVTIPNSVESIGTYAFYKCTSLTEITIPNSVTSIGSYAFWYCSSLAEIAIPNSVTAIGDGAFRDCSLLKEFDIPNSVTWSGWGSSVINGCSSLEIFRIGTGISDLGASQTSYSNSTKIATYTPLTINSEYPMTIILEDTKSSFSMTGFGSTDESAVSRPIFSNLNVKYFYTGRPLENITSWKKYIHDSYKTFNINVTQPYKTIHTLEIGGYCTDVPYFYQSIEELILGEEVATYTVENIYQDNLTSIVCKSTTPPKLTGTFDNRTYLNVVLYVPIGSKEAYQVAEGWRNFWNMEEADVSEIDGIANSRDVTEVARYTISGQKITTPQNGFNIVRYSDGTTRKILVQ